MPRFKRDGGTGGSNPSTRTIREVAEWLKAVRRVFFVLYRIIDNVIHLNWGRGSNS